MSLAIGIHLNDGSLAVEVVGKNGERATTSIQSLATAGLPVKRTRVSFSGTLTDWQPARFADYARGLGIELPYWVDPRHAVFCIEREDGEHLFAPALAFMRAFFWPAKDVLPETFTSLNVDKFAFLRFADDMPVVQIEDGLTGFRSFDPRMGNDRNLRWIHISQSARASAQSVEIGASRGRLTLDLPRGKFELNLVGQRSGRAFYATAVEVESVEVDPTDNLTGQAEVFFLHREPSTDVTRRAGEVLPLVSDAEWKAIEPPLRIHGFSWEAAQLRHVGRYLAQRHWEREAPGVVLELGWLLQQWTTSGVLKTLVDRLQLLRECRFPIEQPFPGHRHPVTVSTQHSNVARVFFDAEFVDRRTDVELLSLGLVCGTTEFYAERPLPLPRSTWQRGSFIETEVVAQMGTGLGMRGDAYAIAAALVNWLNSLGAERVEVRYDFNIDFLLLEQLLALLPGELGTVVVPAHVGYLLDDPAGEAAATLCWANLGAERDLHRHHALADALALQARFYAVQGG